MDNAAFSYVKTVAGQWVATRRAELQSEGTTDLTQSTMLAVSLWASLMNTSEERSVDQDIQEMFRRYRDRDIDLQQLRVWLGNESARVEAQIPRGQLLKLRRGSEARSNGVIAQLLPACEYCLAVGSPKQFESRLNINNIRNVAILPLPAESSRILLRLVLILRDQGRQDLQCTIAVLDVMRFGHSLSRRRRKTGRGIGQFKVRK